MLTFKMLVKNVLDLILRVALWVVLCALGLTNLVLKILVFVPNAVIIGLHDYIDKIAYKFDFPFFQSNNTDYMGGGVDKYVGN